MISPLASITPAPAELSTQPVNSLGQLGEGGRLLVQAGALPLRPPLLLLDEVVNARVAERLGPNQVAVLIKNGLFTLNLPAGTQLNGDLIQLRVASVKPQLSFLLDQGTAGGDAGAASSGDSNASVDVQLSRASRYLTDLLSAAQEAPAGAEAGTGASSGLMLSGAAAGGDTAAGLTVQTRPAATVLVDAGQQNPASVATQLQHTVERSGLFYESHLKAWEGGRLPLDTLRLEPQARIGEAAQLRAAALDIGAATHAHDAGATTPELGRLVQNQLDTLEHKQVLLQGYAWPGQPMQMQIQPETAQEREARGGEDDERSWSTQLSLNMPVLGGMKARVRLVGGAVQVAFTTDEEAAGRLIEANGQRLVDAMAAAGITLAGMTVKSDGG
ncbi:flagellar hook-length control protein FliK [Paludibacterium yongneupense]|uniref:flagellar hook-length control protein FliK n=1 Tax=Paludibacterium yongneupense TaxID=400061 RepID=UPI0003F7D5AE|nr:flagellar hook-length control protein FliK [Paludibacterium yongneupense]